MDTEDNIQLLLLYGVGVGVVTWVVFNHIVYTIIFAFSAHLEYYIMGVKLAEIKLAKLIWCR